MITKIIFYLLAGSFFQKQVPYKPSEEFELKIDYIFKERPPIDRQRVEYEQATDEKVRKAISGPMPYLLIELKILAVTDDEVRIRVVNGNGNLVFNRKATSGTVIKLDWGYTEDIKEKITTNEFTVYFNDEKRKSVSKIYLTILEDGIFMVNDEKRGKF
ncbi:MAG: hypothetical protein JNM78_13635 [Cyclobacteriaceae bacterium]|nr:hypothetical protein [Cyclobacteriaceae bacterium]